VLSGFEASLLG